MADMANPNASSENRVKAGLMPAGAPALTRTLSLQLCWSD